MQLLGLRVLLVCTDLGLPAGLLQPLSKRKQVMQSPKPAERIVKGRDANLWCHGFASGGAGGVFFLVFFFNILYIFFLYKCVTRCPSSTHPPSQAGEQASATRPHPQSLWTLLQSPWPITSLFPWQPVCSAVSLSSWQPREWKKTKREERAGLKRGEEEGVGKQGVKMPESTNRSFGILGQMRCLWTVNSEWWVVRACRAASRDLQPEQIVTQLHRRPHMACHPSPWQWRHIGMSL